MISVVIRNKNESEALAFLLKNLTERYADDIGEILVIDNLSTDDSKEISERFGARFITIAKFSFGGSANICAQEARFSTVVIFSAHSYPVSHDFFKLIREKFQINSNLAGLRCLHSPNDYKNYINGIPATVDPNKSGLIFAGSAFNREVWKKHPFKEDVATFEDKEWTTRVLKEGYAIDFVPAVFCYDVRRNRKQLFFRFKNDIVGNYQLWHEDISLSNAINRTVMSTFKLFKYFFIDLYYILLRFFYLMKFLLNKPNKF